MSEVNSEVREKFLKLKGEYENRNIDTMNCFDEEYNKEQDFKQVVEQYNYMMKGKLGQIGIIRETIAKLSDYRNNIGDVIISIKNIENKYTEMYQTNPMCTNDLKLEPPLFSNLRLLCGDLRQNIDISGNVDLQKIKNLQLFTVKDEYFNSMCNIYEKIEDQITKESMKLASLLEFVGLYRKTINSCDIDKKKILNKYNCSVCFENEVRMCIVPCGHTFCLSCTDKIKNTCFACNGRVKEKTKIFLLGNDDYDDEEVVNSSGDTEPYDPVRREPYR